MPYDLPDPLRFGALVLLVVGGSIWLGGYVTLIMVARTATATMAPADRIAFFRRFGRRFGTLSTTALLTALIAGGVLLGARSWDGLSWAMVGVSALLLIAVATGVAQARRMTRLRHAAIMTPGAPGGQRQIATGSKYAVWLRAALGAISFLLMILILISAV